MNDGMPPKDGSDEKPTGELGKPRLVEPVAKLSSTLLTNDHFQRNTNEFDGANDEALAIRLATLEEEHGDLDAAITSLEENSPYERLTIARLKKKKLHLKDEIQVIKDTMLPDIIA